MALSQKTAFWFFITGKVVRFLFFWLFLYFLLKGTNTLAGYSFNQTVFFFLTFNLVDVISQFLYREAYRFRPKLISGDFDLVLVKPVNSLFSVLMGGADLIDFVTIPPLILAIIYFGGLLSPTPIQILLFMVLIINAVIIATSFYILIISLGILTFEIDNAIMTFRELSSLGRFPIDIYKEPVRGALTFLIPVGIMMTFPGKAMMGILSTGGIIVSFLVSTVLIFFSIKTWNYALTKYSSASS